MAVDSEATKSLLRELVAIDSANPTLVPGARGEAAAAKFLVDFLSREGLPAELSEAVPGRPNVLAWLGRNSSAAAAKGKQHAALAILAHIDTVGAGDMKDPFAPREASGRLYGRGALDIKSGVAAMCTAALTLHREAARLARPLLIAAVVDEECDSRGTEALLRQVSADAAVVLEPTDLKLVIAHKGYAWFEVATHGRAAHGSLPSEGRDAIRMMGKFLGSLDALDRELASRAPHPILGAPSFHASLISGGQELSSYPAECKLQLERRTIPGETPAEIEAELRWLLDALRAGDAEFSCALRRMTFRSSYEISPDAPLVAAASEAIRSVTGSAELAGMAPWTDTALLADAGIPGIVFGPRGKGLHGAEEYVELDSVLACAEVLLLLARKLCC